MHVENWASWYLFMYGTKILLASPVLPWEWSDWSELSHNWISGKDGEVWFTIILESVWNCLNRGTGLLSFRTMCMINMAIVVVMTMIKSGDVIIMGWLQWLFEHCFFSWHLLQVLESLGYHHLSDVHQSMICTNYASQLESLGLWQWAVFVLLHIRDDNRYSNVYILYVSLLSPTKNRINTVGFC